MRREILNNTYHIFGRGLFSKNIFRDEQDRRKFLHYLQVFLKSTNSKLFAFVLMSNHYHILISTEHLDKFLNLVIKAYNGYFCTKYKSREAVFEYPYKIIPKTQLNWSLDTLLYILLNPVEAGMCKSAGGYRWSSYYIYTNRGSEFSNLIDIDDSLVKENYKNLDEFKDALIKKLSYMLEMKAAKRKNKTF